MIITIKGSDLKNNINSDNVIILVPGSNTMISGAGKTTIYFHEYREEESYSYAFIDNETMMHYLRIFNIALQHTDIEIKEHYPELLV